MEIWKDIEKISTSKFNNKLQKYVCVDTKDFTGCGYQVSSLGKVRNKNGKILKSKIKQGYIEIGIRNIDRKQIFVRIHHLVLQTFEGFKEGCSIDHIDRNKENNFLDNLRWATKFEQEENKSLEYIKYLEGLLIKNEILF